MTIIVAGTVLILLVLGRKWCRRPRPRAADVQSLPPPGALSPLQQPRGVGGASGKSDVSDKFRTVRQQKNTKDVTSGVTSATPAAVRTPIAETASTQSESGSGGGSDSSVSARFDVFVSFTNKDIPGVATSLVALLVAKGAIVFNQKRDFAGAPVNRQAMEGFVVSSKVVLALITPHYFDSEPCRWEVEAAASAGVPVVPVHAGEHHPANDVLKMIGLQDDPVKGAAVRACFRRGENLIDVCNIRFVEQVNKEIDTKIVKRFLHLTRPSRMGQWEWSSEGMIWEDELGAGSFGRVFRVQCDGMVLAAKCITVGAANTRGHAEVQELLGREFHALQKAVHANIVKMVGVVLDHPGWMCLLMEYADRGSLRGLLDESPEEIVGEPQVQLGIVRDVVAGMAYLHAQQPKPILHRDLKSDNILLVSCERWEDTFLIAKVADFGLATGIGSTTFATTLRTGVKGGTFAYKAPETFRSEYTEASEVYAFAIIVWELIMGDRPWQQGNHGRPYDEAGLMGAVLRGVRPELKMAGKSLLANLVRRCWQSQPHRRPTFAQLELQLQAAAGSRPSVGRSPSMPQVYEKLFQSVRSMVSVSNGSKQTNVPRVHV